MSIKEKKVPCPQCGGIGWMVDVQVVIGENGEEVQEQFQAQCQNCNGGGVILIQIK